jgi:sterol desaturase/sphingolipid hydroxylase (fatty acid hydroxylase superfamily)
VIQFHHSNVNLPEKWDRWLRMLIVSPNMHRVHHSCLQPETDSNFSSIFSLWDRLAHTLRLRADASTIEFGLSEFDDPQWQTLWGMLKTPFLRPKSTGGSHNGLLLTMQRRPSSRREGA